MSGINWGNVFVIAGIVIDIGATLGYALQKDWNKVLYWACATGLMIALWRMR